MSIILRRSPGVLVVSPAKTVILVDFCRLRAARASFIIFRSISLKFGVGTDVRSIPLYIKTQVDGANGEGATSDFMRVHEENKEFRDLLYIHRL